MTAAEITRALGGRGNMARCPVHKGGKERRPSLSVHDGPGGKLLVNCKAGCPNADVWQALKDRGLVGNGSSSEPVSHAKQPDRRADALAFWEASVPALHTPAQDYLACRGIVIQPPRCIRYHEGDNALVAAVQQKDGHFAGVQRIYLATDNKGTWASGKYSLGPIKGGACRLTPAAESLQLTESVEDGLALLQMTGKATWAVPGAGFMVSFEPPPEVCTLSLCPDHDKAGLQAIEKAAARLSTLVTKVRRLLPPPGRDWCDCLEFFEERAGIREFDGEQDREEAEQRSWVEAFVDGD